jgi:hypothetical protein
MMNIHVTFYGIALFERVKAANGKTAVIVDLPNGRKLDQFDDQTHADKHYAWLVTTRTAPTDQNPFPDITGIQQELDEVKVGFLVDGDISPVNVTGLTNLPEFSKFTEDVARLSFADLLDGHRLAARIMLSIGRMNVKRTDKMKVKFEFNNHLKAGRRHRKEIMGYDVRWSITDIRDAKLILRRLADDVVTFDESLTGNDVYITIGNLPAQLPGDWPKIASPDCRTVDTDTYHHFKLLYKLLRSTKGGWSARVDKQRPLPVPEGTCLNAEMAVSPAAKAPMAITTTTCVPGEWP